MGANMNLDTDKRELIDRRDAIEAVSDYIFFDVYGGMKPVEKCKAEAKSILCDIPTVEPELKWIPCSERLPEKGQKCLVYDKAIGFRVDTYIGHGNPYNWELFVRDYEAWMPIPKLTGVMLSE